MKKRVFDRNEIIKVAYELVKIKGFDNLTFRNIALFMVMSTQPIYFHFQNIRELKLEVLEYIWKKCINSRKNVIYSEDVLVNYFCKMTHFFSKKINLYEKIFQDNKIDIEYFYHISEEYCFQNILKEERIEVHKAMRRRIHFKWMICFHGLIQYSHLGIENIEHLFVEIFEDIIYSSMKEMAK